MSNLLTRNSVVPRSDIVKSAARLGAEIKNVRISDELSEEVVCAIGELLIAHKVIFFRHQGHLDHAEQRRFAVRLGSLIPRSIKRASTPEMAPGQGRGWADHMYMDAVFSDACPKISVLRGGVINPGGRDIIWSSTAAAYLDLPEPLRMLADNLWAVHCSAYDCTGTRHAIGTEQFDDVFTGTIGETAHPVVRVHPETGERLLVLGHSVENFVGLEKYASQRLFERLRSYLTAPENTVCWSWKSGDVVVWDNRASEPYAAAEASVRDRVETRIAFRENMPLSVVGIRGRAGTKSNRRRAKAASFCVH
ncbi:TauD/TfdA family dioxygenase [Bradyrhizobium sp. 173]|uniref:TauD/TfdA dioxygenase family protein n=1 Tax=Bradyrhizobium sp. 173 TaxID=2782644 RepID=UPI001FFB07D6|nr:TauD/TfdA family dioxygenase [Bradyrhizobium sp. 173]MCK1569472.1 TauD/TfdA family dioxygenase [Bradyrhizobium sp. 173]